MAALRAQPADDMSWLNPAWRAPPPAYTLIGDLQTGAGAHATLEAVAAVIAGLRRGRGLQASPTVASYAGSDTFQGLNLYATHRQTGDVEWLGLVVLRHSQADALRIAIAGASQRKAA